MFCVDWRSVKLNVTTYYNPTYHAHELIDGRISRKIARKMAALHLVDFNKSSAALKIKKGHLNGGIMDSSISKSRSIIMGLNDSFHNPYQDHM